MEIWFFFGTLVKKTTLSKSSNLNQWLNGLHFVGKFSQWLQNKYTSQIGLNVGMLEPLIYIHTPITCYDIYNQLW